MEDPEALPLALRQAMELRDRPTVVDVVVTRVPALTVACPRDHGNRGLVSVDRNLAKEILYDLLRCLS